jgi:hypothetical protein
MVGPARRRRAFEFHDVRNWRRPVVKHGIDPQRPLLADELPGDRQCVPGDAVGKIDRAAVGETFKTDQLALPKAVAAFGQGQASIVEETVFPAAEIGCRRAVAVAKLPLAGGAVVERVIAIAKLDKAGERAFIGDADAIVAASDRQIGERVELAAGKNFDLAGACAAAEPHARSIP